MDKTALESKKFMLSVIAMILSSLVTAGAVAAGPVGVSALPFILPTIAGIAIGGVVTQGYQDTKTAVANSKVAISEAENPVSVAQDPKVECN